MWKSSITYANEIIQFNSSGRVQLNLLQGLADHIIWFSLARLRSLDRSSLIYVSPIINIQLAKSIL
jgi:hypothetical protein